MRFWKREIEAERSLVANFSYCIRWESHQEKLPLQALWIRESHRASLKEARMWILHWRTAWRLTFFWQNLLDCQLWFQKRRSLRESLSLNDWRLLETCELFWIQKEDLATFEWPWLRLTNVESLQATKKTGRESWSISHTASFTLNGSENDSP